MVLLVFFYLAFAVLMLLPLLGVWLMIRRMPDLQCSLILVVAATLLLTPSWGPATITVVLVPFGLLFFVTLFTWSWGGGARRVGEHISAIACNSFSGHSSDFSPCDSQVVL